MKKITSILFVQIFFILLSAFKVSAAENCGDIVASASDCSCAANNNHVDDVEGGNSYGSNFCCGWYGPTGDCRVHENENEYGCGEKLASSTVPAGATCGCDGGQWESYKIFGFRNICCGWVQDNDFVDQCLTANPSETTAFCGSTYEAGEKDCICGGGGGEVPMGSGSTVCCGWLRDGSCESTDVGVSNTEVTSGTLNSLNPFTVAGGTEDLSTPGKIISRALKGFIFPIAGIILFISLLLGGFQMLSGAANSKSLDEGKQKITSAIIGFILLFASYWIVQLLELIFGIRILS